MDLSEIVHGLKTKSQPRRSNTSSSSSPEKDKKATQNKKEDGDPSSGKAPKKGTEEKRRNSASDSSSSSPPTRVPTTTRVGSSSGSNKLMCEKCQRTFDSKKQFDQHVAVFHNRSKAAAKSREAMFPCSFCGKPFTSPSKRNVHQNATHMGLKPFQCSICDKAFGYKGDLTKHMATHSGAKNYSCYICGAKFSRNFYVKGFQAFWKGGGRPGQGRGKAHAPKASPLPKYSGRNTFRY